MHRLFRTSALLAAALLAPAGASAAEKTNVLFIAVDDLRACLGCYGNPVVKSPNLDKLAARGVRFDRAYCQYPLCNPSRASLLSGRYPTTTQVTDNTVWLRDRMQDVVTLPQHFRANGYAVARTGKIFHGGLDDDKAWDEGGEPLQRRPPQTPEQQAQRQKNSDRWEAVAGKGENLADHRTATRAVELLGKYRDKPFFLAVGFVKPHTPFVAPKLFFDLYDPNKIPLPADFAPKPTVGDNVPATALTRNGDVFINREPTKEQAREATAAYYACVSATDSHAGRVLDALDKLGLRERTVVVFFGDHGFHLGEKGKWSKHGSLYEPVTRVPLIVAAPSAAGNGKVCGRTVELLDLYPTLAELCGLPAPKGTEGQSLAPLLKDPKAKWEHAAYTVSQRGKEMGRSVRNERFRYTEWTADGKAAEFYDYEADSGELRNAVADPKHAETVAAMKRLLRDGLPAGRARARDGGRDPHDELSHRALE